MLYNACVRALFMCVIANKELETNKVIHHKTDTWDLEEIRSSLAANLAE